MDLEAALKRIGELEAAQEPLEDERDRLKSHNERLLKSVAKANEKVEGLEAERDGLKGQLPGDGSLVLGKDDAKRWAALSDLEVDGTRGDAAKIADALKTGGEAKAKARTLERSNLVAEAAGKDYNAKALGAHLPPTATLEPKKATVNGKETTVYEVVDGDKRTGLEEFVKALEGEHDYVQFRAQPPGVPVLPQVVGGRAGEPDPVKDTLDSIYKRT